MAILTMRAAHRALQLHQKNWGTALAGAWHRWCLGWARRRQREVLRELAEDPHILDDLGITRQQALGEADKPFWR